MLKMLICILSIISISLGLQGQAGAYVNGGLALGTNQFNGVTPDGAKHLGVKVGIDASLVAGNMFFLPGIHYMRLDFDTTGDSFTSPKTPLEIIKGRFGLGFILLQKKKFKLRSRLQGAIHYISNAHTIQLPTSNLNEAYAGVDVGLGISLGAFTMDIEYEKGIINGVYKVPNSNFDFLYATLGFFF